MKISQHQYIEYIETLRHERRKKSNQPVRLLLVILILLVAFFVMQQSHAYISGSIVGWKKPGNITVPTETEIQEMAAEGVVPIPETPVEPEPDPWEQVFESDLEQKSVKVAAGDTLIKILLKAGLPRPDALSVITALSEQFDPGSLRPGQELTFFLDQALEIEPTAFRGMILSLSFDTEIQIMRGKDEKMQVRQFSRELKTRPAKASANISSSLYQAAVNSDLPIDILMQMVRVYSYEVDFQRDIQPGDKFEVLYEEKINWKGDKLQTGGLMYATLHTRGRSLNIYRHESENGVVGFYDANGKSVRRTLMVTPVDGARISSGYGMRRHPIQGYNKMHRGLDFAAPSGTPIMAAGDGIIEYAGRRGSYGNFVRIRHPNSYETRYAHMSGYAENIKKDARIKQGEIIGYVGSTGRSTGPHLHFEVRHAGTFVNPAEVKSPPGRTLEGEELNEFLLAKNNLEELYASLDSPRKLARADQVGALEITHQ